MDVRAIRGLIEQTKTIESESKHLQKLVCEQMERLHHTIELPEDNACESVIRFVVEYIDHVPDFIEALYSASEEVGIQRFIFPFLNIAEENFLAIVTLNEPLTGLDVLLDKAYFAHRLIEEVNDQYLQKAGSTLIPMNMTWSNLIIHSVLGEPFANELDKVVEETVNHMMRSQGIYSQSQFESFTSMRNPERWIEIWTQFNCLSQRTDIELNFTACSQ